ncbi:MAG: MMPL family transporter [Acidimicrobiia bacterium]|nr:MMPL family transporter [Acidimicrobiia bacterium]
MLFARLGSAVARRAWLVVILAAIAFAGAGAIGADVANSLSSGGFSAPGAESTVAREVIEDRFGADAPNLVLLARPDPGTTDAATTVDVTTIRDAGLALTDRLAAEEGVADVISYWSLGGAPPLAADDRRSALVLASINGSDTAVNDRVGELIERYTGTTGDGLEVAVGGQAAVFHEVGETIESDLRTAELIALPLTLLLLLWVFRSVVAALLPVLIGGFAIVGTFVVLELLASVTEVSIFALNLTTALGLGLAIDYSLFVVTRYREERSGGLETRPALLRTVMTAGRAVAISGITVAASLAALLIFPLSFLRSFAYAGIPVVLLAVTGAVVVLPAILMVLGHRIDAGRIGRRRDPAEAAARAGRTWARLATAVMRRPLPIATVVVLVLLALGTPFLNINLGTPDDRVLSVDAASRQVSDALRSDYSSNEAQATTVVFTAESALDTDLATSAADTAAVLSTLASVSRVDSDSGVWLDGTQVLPAAPGDRRFAADDVEWLSVVPAVEPISADGEQLVADIREVATTAAGATVLVGGPSAELVDTKAALQARVPLALAIIASVIFVLLFLTFGSLLVPLKALVLNALSLTATLGAMVWVFQDGNLSGILGFTPTGMLDATTPILMFCIAFGLSMDYEVFLLSRIKEEYDRTGDNSASVVAGMARTGRVITAAALIISVVFLAFATSSVAFMTLFGLGLALAVLMDATVVRGLLVPSFMVMAGDANWWAPRWMRRIYHAVGMSDAAAEAAADSMVVDLSDAVGQAAPSDPSDQSASPPVGAGTP